MAKLTDTKAMVKLKQGDTQEKEEKKEKCPNIGVKEIPEKVELYGPNSKCGPIRDPQFVHECPAYSITTPAHHERVKKEGFRVKAGKKLKAKKQLLKCVISSGTIADGPSKDQTYYIGACVPDGDAKDHGDSITDYEEEPC